MASRQIPIDVDPGYEANFRNRRRDSEPVSEIPHDASNRTFQRRHSEDPHKQSWAPTYHQSPFTSFGENQKLTRRGSMPVYLRPQPGKRDRFDEIVERMMEDDDCSLLSGIMNHDFNPFHSQDDNNDEETGHAKLHRRPSEPVSRRPFAMNPKKDYIEIPVQIIRKDDDPETTCTLSSEDNIDSTTANDSIEQTSEGTMKNSPKMVEDAVQTDEGIVILINKDDVKNTDTEIIQGIGIDINAETESDKGDKENLYHIKDLEESFKQIHEKVTAFHESENKDSTNREYLQLEELLMKTLMSLDAVEANGSQCVREARRSVVMQVQEDLKELEMKKQQK